MLKELFHNNKINIAKIIIGATGWVWFMIPVVFSGIVNIGTAGGLLFFGCLFLWGIFGKKLRAKSRDKKGAKVFLYILRTGYTAFSVLFLIESIFMAGTLIKTPPMGENTVIVLGCAVYGETPSQMLRLRLDAVEKYMKENPDANAVLSGGQGPDEDIPEALCMYRELIKRGINEDRLYMEDKSTNTRENIAFSFEVIEENSLSENISIVTNNFHLFRAGLSVKERGVECSYISAYTPLPLLPTYIMREYLGIVAQIFFGRA